MVERSIEPFKHACPPSQTETVGSAITPDRFYYCYRGTSVHLNVEFLSQQVEYLLANAPLGPCISRTHGDFPRIALIVCQIMQRGLAGFLDLGQSILVFLHGNRIGIVCG